MVLEILYRNLPPLLVFLTLAGTSWLWGGMRADPLIDHLPWLLALTLEALLFLPQRRPYEDMLQARERLWRKLAHDPLLYVVLGFLLLLVIPLFNRGLCPNCDAQAIAAGADPKATVPFLPFCVDVADQVHVLTWFVPAFLAMLAARHALVREGKRVLFEMIVWNGAALAVFGFIEQATGADFVFWTKLEHPVYFFSTFGYPNSGGAFFTMIFAFSIGLWRYHVKETELLAMANAGRRTVGQSTYWLRAHYPLIATVLSLFAVLYTRSRAAVLLTGVLAACAGVYVVLETLGRHAAYARRLRTIICSAVGMIVVGVLVFVFAPKEISAEMKTADLAAIADRVTGKMEWHVTASWEIFKEHPFFGVGGWGYRHFSLPYAPQSARRSFGRGAQGSANVHNDYLQFLCEQGSVGVLLLVAMVVILMWPVCTVWGRLYMTSRFVRSNQAPPKPKAIFALPAAAFWIYAGNVCLLVHAFGDCPMRGAAVLSLFFVSLALAEGFVPRMEELEQTSNGDKIPIPDDVLEFQRKHPEGLRHHHRHHHHSSEE